MKRAELYARVCHAVMIEGLSQREAARHFGIDPRMVKEGAALFCAAGLCPDASASSPKTRSVHRYYRPHPGRGQRASEEAPPDLEAA
ncbi:MAG: hypothetical protein ACU84Q_21735 [Gammaproteobacteria bacterium]